MRLDSQFYQRDVLEVAPDLLGKTLVRKFESGDELRVTITEVEAYRGTDDLGCHASKGMTVYCAAKPIATALGIRAIL